MKVTEGIPQRFTGVTSAPTRGSQRAKLVANGTGRVGSDNGYRTDGKGLYSGPGVWQNARAAELRRSVDEMAEQTARYNGNLSAEVNPVRAHLVQDVLQLGVNLEPMCHLQGRMHDYRLNSAMIMQDPPHFGQEEPARQIGERLPPGVPTAAEMSLKEELKAVKDQLAAVTQENRQLKSKDLEYRTLELELSALKEDLALARQRPSLELEELKKENSQLAEELKKVRKEQEQQAEASPATRANCSESRLRAAMTSQGTSVTTLRSAIDSAAALLEEARRELERKELRERRAAYERLHSALGKDDEGELAEALLMALSTGVDAEEIKNGQAKLHQLQSLTPEERAAKEAREHEAERKKEAYMLLKKDNPTLMMEFLDQLPAAIRWQDWHDYAGRNLIRAARELRAERVRAALQKRLDAEAPEDTNKRRSWHRLDRLGSVSSAEGDGSQISLETPLARGSSSVGLADLPEFSTPNQLQRKVSDVRSEAPATPESKPLVAPATPAASEQMASSPLRELGATEEAALKAKAFRAATQDDCESLALVLEQVPVEVWSKWENKAGDDLLTLSQTRSAADTYSMLAKALGITREMKRESLNEGDTVWVFLKGEVQARQATIKEDTPDEADMVKLEFWDGGDFQYIERCLIQKKLN